MGATAQPMKFKPRSEQVKIESTCGGKLLNWYAVSTKPRQEHEVEVNLAHMGLVTFCPRIRERKLIRRCYQLRTSTLFPGYLFAKFDVSSQYRAVHYARGVRGVVAFGGVPAVVDQAMIEAIRERLLDGYLQVREAKFVPGQIVHIKQGRLNGLEAIFERETSGGERAVLLLRALAYQARVVVELDNIVNL